MGSDYSAVQKALAEGTEPAMLCMTCPWDRNCVSPPTMTSAEIDAKLAEAVAEDDKRTTAAVAGGQNPGMPAATLLTAITYAGKDTSAQVCPVFALRLRSGAGRRAADAIRSLMQDWSDAS